MSCCGANPGYDELDEVSRLVSTKARGVSANLARQWICRRPARRPGRGGADGGGLCGQARPAALGLQAPVLGAQIRLGKIRRAVRRVLARQAGQVAIGHHGLGEGRQQPVAEKPARQQVRAGPAARRRRIRCRPRTKRRSIAPAKAAWKAPRAPKISAKSISARWPTLTRSRRPMPSRRGWQGPCARG